MVSSCSFLVSFLHTAAAVSGRRKDPGCLRQSLAHAVDPGIVVKILWGVRKRPYSANQIPLPSEVARAGYRTARTGGGKRKPAECVIQGAYRRF